MEDVGLADLDLVEPECVERAGQDGGAGDDRGGAVGVEAGDLPALGERQGGEAVAQAARRWRRLSRWPCTRSGS